MWRQTTWVLLVVVGCGLLFMSVFPIFAYMRFEEPLQTALVASKVIMPLAGMLCLFGAAALKSRKVRR